MPKQDLCKVTTGRWPLIKGRFGLVRHLGLHRTVDLCSSRLSVKLRLKRCPLLKPCNFERVGSCGLMKQRPVLK